MSAAARSPEIDPRPASRGFLAWARRGPITIFLVWALGIGWPLLAIPTSLE